MQNHSILHYVLLVAGAPVFGLGEGDDVIKASRNVDAFSHRTGNQGTMIVSQNPDKSGLFEVKVQQGSSASLLLSSLFKQNEAGVFAPIPVLLKNVLTGESAGGTKGYITRPADIVRGTNDNDETWTIVVEDYDVLFTLLPAV